MTQYIGQITVIIDADNESIAETCIRDFAQRIEDESEAVVFADHNGALVEDPVTGSFNAGVALHLFATGLAEDSYVAAQGRMTGADGRVQVRRDADGTVWIGGRCAMVAEQAVLTLPGGSG